MSRRRRSSLSVFAVALAATMLVAGPATAASKPTPPPPVATVTWSGNGTTVAGETRALKDTRCDPSSTAYLLWVLSGSKATSASIALPGGPQNMGKPTVDKRTGYATFKVTWTPGRAIDLDVLYVAPVVATYNDAKNKATLTVSHGCVGVGGGATVPGAPASIAAEGGPKKVRVRWTAPASDGGSAVTGYRVQFGTSVSGPFSDGVNGCDADTTGGPAVLSCIETSLTNDTAYWFRVAAANAEGTGAYTTPAKATPGAIVSLSFGDIHSCAVLSNGLARCWGSNWGGQLGDGTTTDSTAGVTVRDLSTATKGAVNGGTGHSCAILADTTVRCWGDNYSGGLGNNTTTSSSTPVKVCAVGATDCAANPLTGVTSLALAEYFSCAVASGAVVCWGENGDGALGDGTTTDRRTPVATGITNATAVSAQSISACALLADTTVKCWGTNYAGQLGRGTTNFVPNPTPALVCGVGQTDCVNNPLTGVTAISSTYATTCAITSGGTVCWGANWEGELGANLPANKSTSPVWVCAVGQTDCPNNRLTGVTALAAGGFKVCALLSDTSVVCWGANWSGQLGIGTNLGPDTCGPVACALTPVVVKDAAGTGTLSGITLLSANEGVSADHACGYTSGGTLYCWGENGDGQLGDGTKTDRMLPVVVDAP